jgi:formate hydrogenlyase subunit 4
MAVILDFAVQGGQMLLVLLLAPLLTGFVRKVKARLLRRKGPPVVQPYRDLIRLFQKDVVLATNASWLFRVAPYLIFAATWVAAALVPTFATGLLFSWTADLIAIKHSSAAFASSWLCRHDAGTSFGVSAPAARDDRLSRRTGHADDRLHLGARRRHDPALRHGRISCLRRVGLARLARHGADRADHGGDCRECAHPRRQSRDAPELTMVHEAMILEYSGRHLAVIELRRR